MAKLKKRFLTTFSDYDEIAVVGEGGSGRVYKVLDYKKREFALKLLHPDRATKEKRARFKNELIFGQQTNHQNIIKVVDHGIYVEKDQESPFYVMRYYRKSLRDLLNEGDFSVKIDKYIANLLDGVEAAHKLGIVHRDIKPENILYDERNDNLIIADFGVAMFSEEELYIAVRTKNTTRLANFRYSAPEQRDPSKSGLVDQRADIFSIGLVVNEMFTRDTPQGVGFKTISQIDEDHSYLDEIIERMIQHIPEERYQAISDIKRELMGNKQRYIEQQELNVAKSMVVKRSEDVDALITDPPELINATWNNGILSLELSQVVNHKWVDAMLNMGSHSSVSRKGPERFDVKENIASVSSDDENTNRKVIDHFKNWLPRINNGYKQLLEREEKERFLQEKKNAEELIEKRERHIRMNDNLRI